MSTNNAIVIKDFTKRYGDFLAVDNISLDVKAGDFFAFLGPNGAGKTSTINAITGLSNFQHGTITVNNNDVILDYRKARRDIGLCMQEFNFDPFLDIRRLLVYQAGYFGIPSKQAAAKADYLLERFKLAEKRKEDFRSLSGGMKRRLLICRALIHNPSVLILDEPTAGADLELRHMIWDYLTELNQKEKITIFLTTHYMEEAEALSNTIAIIHKGKIVANGPKQSVLKGQALSDVYLELTNDN